MNYNINYTISDFKKFIEFNENERPILSAKLGVLGKKDCFKLNMLLENKKEVNAPNYNQDQYPAIDLMFSLALISKLYVRANDEKGKFRLIMTPNMGSFKSLNEYEKYVFLLQTYWTKYNFEDKFDRWINILAFYNILAGIADAKEGQKIVKNVEYGLDAMYSEGAYFLHHLKFFGFGEIELINGVKSKYEDSIRSFLPNAFGIKTSKFLLSKALAYWNRKDLEFLFAVMKNKMNSNKKEKAFDIFKNLFEEKLVKNTVQTQAIDRSGVYIFKVSLSKKIWRKISLSHKHTLSDLHNAIQEAFCFDNDHLYAFFIDGNEKTGEPIYCEDMEKCENTTENTSIGSLELYKGQKMLYLFDFGDEWKFDVELVEIMKDTPIPLKPIIVESKGKAPEQYYGENW